MANNMWIENDPAKKKFIRFEGTLPEKLYRYRTVSADTIDDRLIDFEVLEEGIYLAGLHELNDPDEGRFDLSWGREYAEILAYWCRAITSCQPDYSPAQVVAEAKRNTDEVIASGYRLPERVVTYTRSTFEQVIRMACFTTLPTNFSMWANYAKYLNPEGKQIDHGGICIEYRVDDGWRDMTLHPVKYSNEVPVINITRQDEAEVCNALYSKSEEWGCEKEWRIVQTIQSRPPFPSNLTVNSKIRLENGISSIIFGLKTPDDIIKKIQSRVELKNREISFKRLARNPVTFERELIALK